MTTSSKRYPRKKKYKGSKVNVPVGAARVNQIARVHRVSIQTVSAMREREAVAIADRKQRLISIFGNAAEIAGERMEEVAGKASLRNAGTTAGIATDKLLALTFKLRTV